ncbi:chymotrypsin-like [Anticarsia gemmatalis]|uniref:chymotrypsin-like n=1 Tax=Anticarsia gemmatalis TaxID=129554 RepID=UPI003F7712C1
MKVAQSILFVVHAIRIVQSEMEPFVVNGVAIPIDSAPYSAHLSIQCVSSEGKNTFICGSSILNQAVVLTAAHCIYGCAITSTVIVSAGHHQKGKGVTAFAKRMLMHEKYDQRTTSNDIAMIGLKTRFPLSSKVSRVALLRNPPYKEEAVIAGWGLINEVEKIKATELIYTKQYVMTTKDCLKIIKSKPEGTFCAKAKDSSYASKGDSGSGLLVRKYIQIGVVSYKKPKWSRNVVVYTDIGYHYNWIVNNAKRVYCSD